MIRAVQCNNIHHTLSVGSVVDAIFFHRVIFTFHPDAIYGDLGVGVLGFGVLC